MERCLCHIVSAPLLEHGEDPRKEIKLFTRDDHPGLYCVDVAVLGGVGDPSNRHVRSEVGEAVFAYFLSVT